jgi:hypothetical protein
MQQSSPRTHPIVNDIYVADDDPYFAHTINAPGLHVFRVRVGPGWYVLRYWRNSRYTEVWDGGTYPESWFQQDWSQFAWGPFGKPEQSRPHLYLVRS